ncbi:hypothetical protein PoB_007480600 [Plakobranchus ocellatus]|uniref:Uncharacterized protein n=1 Tax=Plakobranchus ocellatus TaxID=259542 RepID=A0AAV4DWT5_9GAST|nr:hypothetical protein PoB_007480600 [Plakobranchus ocellatus]
MFLPDETISLESPFTSLPHDSKFRDMVLLRFHSSGSQYPLTVCLWFCSLAFGITPNPPQQGDLRPSGPPSDQGAGGGGRTRDRRVPADLRADSLATVLPTPLP